MASRHPQRKLARFLVLLGVLPLSSCGSTPPGDGSSERIAQLQKERLELQGQIERLEQQTKRLQGQVETLAGLPAAVEKSYLYHLKQVKLSKYTGLYDRSGDKVVDTLVVYLKPIDQDGDIVKAAGLVDVQLWNLEGSPQGAMIGQWRVEPPELRESWYASLLTINYRLEFELPPTARALGSPLTVKVQFTEMLSGKVFAQQRIAPSHVY